MDFQWRSRYKQNTPMKPSKWGIKVFCMSDAKNKYLMIFRPYDEKDNSKEKISEKIVKSLCEDMYGKKIHDIC